MRKFVDSGAAFMIVALICFIAGVTAENGIVFIGIGAFWMIMAIVTRSKKAKGKTEGSEDNRD